MHINMIHTEEYDQFIRIGHEGTMHDDDNISIHAQTLLEELEHYRCLTQHAAKLRVEESIRFSARQVLNNRSSPNTNT